MEILLTTAERVRLRTAMKQTASARLYRRLQAVFLAGEGHLGHADGRHHRSECP